MTVLINTQSKGSESSHSTATQSSQPLIPPMDQLPPQFTVKEWPSLTIPDYEFEKCYKLVRKLKQMYDSSGFGWSPANKRKEMKKDGQVYFVVYKTNPASKKPTEGSPSKKRRIDKPSNQGLRETTENEHTNTAPTPRPQVVAFLLLALREKEFVDDEEIPPDQENTTVSYIYELHCTKETRGQGIGSHLIELAKNRCRQIPESKKLMLTVFVANVKAQSFYLWNGFTVFGPELAGLQEREHEIGSMGRYPRYFRKPRNDTESTDKRLHPDVVLRHAPPNTTGWFQMVWEMGKNQDI